MTTATDLFVNSSGQNYPIRQRLTYLNSRNFQPDDFDEIWDELVAFFDEYADELLPDDIGADGEAG